VAENARILVTDGEARAALTITRSLGRAGHSVVVSSSRKRSLAGVSRHCVESVWTENPMNEPDVWRDQVRSLLVRSGIDLIIPTTDPSILALLESDRPWEATVPFPTLASFKGLSDKAKLMDVALDLGIAVPRQWTVPEKDGAESCFPPSAQFPLVVKPARSVVGPAGSREKVGVEYASSPEELKGISQRLPADAFPLLLQEKINGPGIGVFLLIWDGETKAVFGHRRIREKPPSGGVSVLRESVSVPAGLLAQSERLLHAFDWQGVAMVEYKIDLETGTPYLMEINGRFWGSLQLAVDAGVDFPALLVSHALGQTPPPVRDYRLGVQLQWFWGDLDHLNLVLRGKGMGPGQKFGRWNTLKAFLATSLGLGPPVGKEVFSVRDLRPFLVESWDWLRRR